MQDNPRNYAQDIMQYAMRDLEIISEHVNA